MLKLQPDLSSYLAETAIKQKYNPPAYNLTPEVQQFCKSSKGNIYSFYLIHQRYIINCLIVDTVYSCLDQQQKDYMQYRYKGGESLTYISTKLDVPVHTLLCWNKQIQHNIETMIFYNLELNDMFYLSKLINMINILEVRIEALMMGLTAGVRVNMSWLNSLIKKRGCYRQILHDLSVCQATPDESLYNWIMTYRCTYPDISVTDLSHKAYINRATIYRHINTFKSRVEDIFSSAGISISL